MNSDILQLIEELNKMIRIDWMSLRNNIFGGWINFCYIDRLKYIDG